MIETIRAERELLDICRECARAELGDGATDAQIKARATELYEGPPPRANQAESAEARRIREANTRLARRNYDRWLA
jgi:hypothetical protein